MGPEMPARLVGLVGGPRFSDSVASRSVVFTRSPDGGDQMEFVSQSARLMRVVEPCLFSGLSRESRDALFNLGSQRTRPFKSSLPKVSYQLRRPIHTAPLICVTTPRVTLAWSHRLSRLLITVLLHSHCDLL